MYTHFKYLLNYQTAVQEYQPWVFTLDDQEYRDPTWRFYWLLTIQNSYFVCTAERNLETVAHTFAMIAENQSKAMTYNDQILKFYQQQGVSFQTGFDQALFFQNWTRKFNQLQYASLAGKAFGQSVVGAGGMGLIGGKTPAVAPVLARANNDVVKLLRGGTGVGAVVGAIGGGMNAVNNIFKTTLDNQLREKQAVYGVQSLLAQQTDLANSPAATSGLQKLELNYWFTSYSTKTKIDSRQKPYLTVLAPGYNDFIAQALIYHKYGYLLDQEEIIDFNDEWTRYYFNYWQIHNLEQALVKTNLNSMVVNWFNSLFNQGIRLWNVFHTGVIFNDYSQENWENKIIRPAHEN